MTPQQQQGCWQQQGSQQQQQRQLSKQVTQAGEGTSSTAKMPATAGSVWKSYKSGSK